MEIFLEIETYIALFTLTIIEIILGIDNIIFIFKSLKALLLYLNDLETTTKRN